MLDMSEIGYFVYMTECEEKKRQKEAAGIDILDNTSSVGAESEEKKTKSPMYVRYKYI